MVKKEKLDKLLKLKESGIINEDEYNKKIEKINIEESKEEESKEEESKENVENSLENKLDKTLEVVENLGKNVDDSVDKIKNKFTFKKIILIIILFGVFMAILGELGIIERKDIKDKSENKPQSNISQNIKYNNVW